MWKFGGEGVLGFLFYLFINVGAIVGAILGFIGIRIGTYLCLLAGISFPLFLLYMYLPNPSTFFVDFFKSLLESFYISLPMLLLFIGGIISFIELQLEFRRNNVIF